MASNNNIIIIRDATIEEERKLVVATPISVWVLSYYKHYKPYYHWFKPKSKQILQPLMECEHDYMGNVVGT
jgi:hypothetical protein